ncbi:zinc finger protein 69 homolog B-like isoform X2 [Leguminivora glycinivorella]|nr:zinc finger protein 69 homolog B-like isoform X2 [Leguminivora glycinivorella]
MCSKTFFDKQPFIDHMDSHSTDRKYKCKECGLALKTQLTLRKHMHVVHSGVKKYACTVCNKTFKISWSLKVHMRTHTKERPYPCRFCAMRFARSHHLMRHERTIHKCMKAE